MAWSVESLNDVVDVELEELPADMRARFRYISVLIGEFGLERSASPTSSTFAALSGKCA
jgi:hypothetical protein